MLGLKALTDRICTTCKDGQKSWNFPKFSMLSHAFPGICTKGISTNYNMKPGEHQCNICTPQTKMTLRNLEAGSAYRLSPQSLVSKEAQVKLWGITTHIQAKGNKFPRKLIYIHREKITWSVAVHSIMDLEKVCAQSVGHLCVEAVHICDNQHKWTWSTYDCGNKKQVDKQVWNYQLLPMVTVNLHSDNKAWSVHLYTWSNCAGHCYWGRTPSRKAGINNKGDFASISNIRHTTAAWGVTPHLSEGAFRWSPILILQSSAQVIPLCQSLHLTSNRNQFFNSRY